MDEERKKKKQDDDGVDIGRTMTVSLFLILLTFFILLNSIAVIDENKKRVALGSLLGSFGQLPGGKSPFGGGRNILPPEAPLLDESLTKEEALEIYLQIRDLVAGRLPIDSLIQKLSNELN